MTNYLFFGKRLRKLGIFFKMPYQEFDRDMSWEEARRILEQMNLDHFGNENGKRLRSIFEIRQRIRRGEATIGDLERIYDKIEKEDSEFFQRHAETLKAILEGTSEVRLKVRKGY